MKLTPEKAKSLRALGATISGKQIVRKDAPVEATKPVAVPEPLPAAVPQQAQKLSTAVLDSLVQVVAASENNTKSILALHSAMLKTMAEIAKPKKREWNCTIDRNAKGEMSTVKIKEQ